MAKRNRKTDRLQAAPAQPRPLVMPAAPGPLMSPQERNDRLLEMVLRENDALKARCGQLEQLANQFGVISRCLVLALLEGTDERTVTISEERLAEAGEAAVGVDNQGPGVPENGLLLTLQTGPPWAAATEA